MIKNNKKEALPKGTVLNGRNFRYRISDVLGLGSFGITYLADIINEEGKKTNMRVALKELFIAECNERDGENVSIFKDGQIFDEFKGKFTREADNLHEIDHSNVINVFEWFEANGTAYYSMTYIDGESLEQVLDRKGRLRETEALEVAESLAAALDTIHSFGLLHLDVRPGNVMMAGGKVPVLIDFGLAKHFNDKGEPDTSLGLTEGTPGYAPMEQATYQPGNGLPATIDVYSLGATLFRMLAGEEPPTASDLFNDGFPREALTGKGVGHAAVDIVEKAMQPLWRNRYQNASQMEKAIRIALNKGEDSDDGRKISADRIPPMALKHDSKDSPEENPVTSMQHDDEMTSVNETTSLVNPTDEATSLESENTLVAMTDGYQPDEDTRIALPGSMPPPVPGYPLPETGAYARKKKKVLAVSLVACIVALVATLAVVGIYSGWLGDLFYTPVETVVLEAD